MWHRTIQRGQRGGILVHDMMNPVYCPKCKQVIPEDVHYCPHCGAAASLRARREAMASAQAASREETSQREESAEEGEHQERGWWLRRFWSMTNKPVFSPVSPSEKPPDFIEYTWQALKHIGAAIIYGVPFADFGIRRFTVAMSNIDVNFDNRGALIGVAAAICLSYGLALLFDVPGREPIFGATHDASKSVGNRPAMRVWGIVLVLAGFIISCWALDILFVLLCLWGAVCSIIAAACVIIWGVNDHTSYTRWRRTTENTQGHQ